MKRNPSKNSLSKRPHMHLLQSAPEIHQLRIRAAGRPHSMRLRNQLRLSYMPPLVRPDAEPEAHYVIVTGNDAKAVTTGVGYERS
jgi:hypothetical protein